MTCMTTSNYESHLVFSTFRVRSQLTTRMFFYRPQTKFAGGTWSEGGRGTWSRGGHLVRGVYLVLGGGRGVCGKPPTATAAGGTHPTGMHSCLSLSLVVEFSEFIETSN